MGPWDFVLPRKVAHVQRRGLQRALGRALAATVGAMLCASPDGAALAQDAALGAGGVAQFEVPGYAMDGLYGLDQGRPIFGLDRTIVEEAQDRFSGGLGSSSTFMDEDRTLIDESAVEQPIDDSSDHILSSSDVPASILALQHEGWAEILQRPDGGWGPLLDPQADLVGNAIAMPTFDDPEVLEPYLDLLNFITVGPQVGVRVLRGPDELGTQELCDVAMDINVATMGSLEVLTPSGGTLLPVRPGCRVEVHAGGAAVRLESPIDLDVNGGLTGDLSCLRPRNVDLQAVGGQVNAARVLSVLLVGMGPRLRLIDGRVVLARPERCSDDVKTVGVRHCSGLVEPNGLTVWTAAHCVLSNELRFLDGLSAGLGESVPCSADATLRVVSLLGLTRDDLVVPEDFIRPCARVDIVAPDIARVILASPLAVPPADGTDVAPWHLPQQGELDALLVEGRRLYGTGYMQGIELYEMTGGRVVPMEHCLAALAFGLGRVPQGLSDDEEASAVRVAMVELRGEVPPQAITYEGFGCTTMDTMVGASGGPVLAVTDDGASLVLVGLISAAAWVDLTLECKAIDRPVLQDDCSTGPSGGPAPGGFNLFAIMPG